jgi:phospholipid/cholesterol/gamma-HCH transport system substrate-binding protein
LAAPDEYGGSLPSQEQVRWAQLRVGLTVLFSSLTLAVLIFLMTGTTGLFTKKFTLYSYVDNAGGLRNGAPVRLQGVDIGNVTDIRVVQGRGMTPVQVTMKIGAKNNVRDFVKKDSVVLLSTAGVLGETFVDIDSTTAKLGPAQDNDTLPAKDVPEIQDVVRASQSTLQNVNSLLLRADRIMTFVESGQGSVGKLIYDKQLYENINRSVTQMNGILNDINNGKGSVGKLLKDEELYTKLNASIDKLNRTIDAVDRGEGTVGKLVHDPALYNNANQTISKANQLMDSINSGQGTLGRLAKDPELARKLDETITRLNTITTGLANGEGSAGRFLKDPSLYNNSDQMLVETRALVKAIRENPKKYLTIHFKIF